MFTRFKGNPKLGIVLIFLVIFLASFLRLYKLDQVPPSLSWDEAAVGYNAYTIANWGKDEWGRSFPAYFKSFEDDKSPVHIYLTAISVRILGLSEFSTRLPMAIIGILGVVVVFFLGKTLFKSYTAGILAAIVLAVSPYSLQFSRFNHEAIVTAFFFMLGLLLFFKSLKEKPAYLPWAFLSFGITILSYHSAKIVVPPMVLLLVVLYHKELWKIKKHFLFGILAVFLVLSVIVFNPALLGTSRAKQSSVPFEAISSTVLYQKTGNEILGRAEFSWERYKTYFNYEFLFVSGDKIARHSSQGAGEFYKLDLVFLIIGVLALVRLKSRVSVILLAWALLAPIPGSISGGLSETAHAARSLFMIGSWHLIAAFGYYNIFRLFKKPVLQIALAVALLGFLGWEMNSYLNYYYGEYTKRYAIEWQYGMKQIGQFLKEHDGYMQVYMTDARSQPYIFLLYHLKTPLPNFLETVSYNQTQSRPSNLVSFFDKYYLGGWDALESFPSPGVLYVVTPSQYDGLRHKNQFQVKELVKYPNGLDAYYLVALY